MFIILNNEEFEIYELENKKIIIDRIAVKFNSLPKYLYFDPELKIENGYKIKVVDYLEKIKNYKILDIYKLYYEIKEHKFELTIEDILYPWFYYNNKLGNLLINKETTNSDLILNEIYQEIKKISDIYINFTVKEIKDIIKKNKPLFEKQLNDLVVNTQTYVSTMNIYYNIKKGVDYEKIIIEKSETDYILDMEYITLLEIFNNIILDKNIPFASYNEFYKISKEILPLEEWNLSLTDYIIIRVLEKQNPKGIKQDNYSMSIIGQEENYPVLRMICNLLPGNISEEQYKNNVLKSIKNPKIKEKKEVLLKGKFIIPNQKLNKYVFSDLVMNNPIFSKFIYINERESASKTKSELYIYVEHPIYGLMTCNMTENNDIPDYDSYIKINITKSKNTESIYEFQKIISKLFVIYNNEYDNIIYEYRKYISKFGEISKQKDIFKKKDILRLQDVAKSIIEYGRDDRDTKIKKGQKEQQYSRFCAKLPRVVSKDEAEKFGNYMLFPKESHLDTTELGKIDQNYYICDEHIDSGHIYPGLVENKLKSSEIIQGLPCCYKEDHSKIKGKLYRQYFYEDELIKERKNTLSQKIIKTNKFVNITSTGVLPKNISTFFDIIHPLNDYRRTGMSRGPNSFIECVYEALGLDIFKDIIIDKNIRSNYIENIRKTKLSEIVKNTGICRQELYNKSNKQIFEYFDPLNDKFNEYFDPRMFMTLIEQVYKCNIFLFTRDKNDDGEMTLPYYSQYYLKYNNNYPCIFIYENPGNVSDNPLYPQCELIINFKENNSIYSFVYDDYICIESRKVYENLSLIYINNNLIRSINFDIDLKYIHSQLIDINGKCRILYIKYKIDNIMSYVSLFTDPLPPLMVKENDISLSNQKIYKLDIKYLNDFCKLFNIKIINQVIKNNVIVQIIGQINNNLTNVYIPIKNSVEKYIIKDLPISNELIYIEDNKSIMNEFNNNKKYARYICEYAIWLLSNYLYNQGYIIDTQVEKSDIYIGILKVNIDYKILNDFYDKNIIIDNTFEYKDIKETFTYESGLLKDSKLVLLNEIMFSRLDYYIKLYIKRNKQKVINYRLYKSMETYFQDISDMTIYPNQVILYGKYAVQRWIYDRKSNYIIQNTLNKDITNMSPYFLKNNNIKEYTPYGLISNSYIYLAQTVDNIYKAMELGKLWSEYGYNYGGNIVIDENKVYESYLYTYKNKDNIKIYNINGIRNNYNIKIIGFKIKSDDKILDMYTVLLKF